MTSDEKRVYLLLKAVIFYYHGLDQQEKVDLENAAKRLEAPEELRWALDFIEKDHMNSFERARAFLNDVIGDYPKEKRVNLINMVWESNNLKGYVTEMEATAMLKLARDWMVEKELIELVLK
ncbi:MAG: hypothetical protein HOP08_10990 [Cyclobacteriaceae bacterium]|nr:hypothetical protein [Cyclobacteriaceae bacterium]